MFTHTGIKISHVLLIYSFIIKSSPHDFPYKTYKTTTNKTYTMFIYKTIGLYIQIKETLKR
jgi:hypothetical protein